MVAKVIITYPFLKNPLHKNKSLYIGWKIKIMPL